MVLLRLLSQLPKVELVVAHFDHGMRPDSAADCQFVSDQAAIYDMQFVSGKADLGASASEATARSARYDFLRGAQLTQNADAIVTAHHQDDVLETAIINLSRGTGRRGLTALSSRPGLVRPLLDISKVELVDYAKRAGLDWRDDVTNNDPRYLRNYIRLYLMPKIIGADRQQFLNLISTLRRVNTELDQLLTTSLEQLRVESKLDRAAICALPTDVMKEVLMIWWRQNGFINYESKTLVRVIQDLKTCHTGTIIPLKSGFFMSIEKHLLALHDEER